MRVSSRITHLPRSRESIRSRSPAPRRGTTATAGQSGYIVTLLLLLIFYIRVLYTRRPTCSEGIRFELRSRSNVHIEERASQSSGKTVDSHSRTYRTDSLFCSRVAPCTSPRSTITVLLRSHRTGPASTSVHTSAARYTYLPRKCFPPHAVWSFWSRASPLSRPPACRRRCPSNLPRLQRPQIDHRHRGTSWTTCCSTPVSWRPRRPVKRSAITLTRSRMSPSCLWVNKPYRII